MRACEELGRQVKTLAALDAAAMPAWAADHLARCPTCTRELMQARLARGLLAAAGEGQEPPADFAQRVMAALPPSHPARVADPDLWRLGWRLVPAFAATAAMLLILFQFEAGLGSVSVGVAPGLTPGLLPVEALSASEDLVLRGAAPDLDLVLAAVMERDGR
ncbi:MAG TPA: hypothetical protein VLG48_01115 [Candidatus Methylomirabilis sp.]|nr:hypothetical protein [Candidatus Methylomirabilis sp.]